MEEFESARERREDDLLDKLITYKNPIHLVDPSADEFRERNTYSRAGKFENVEDLLRHVFFNVFAGKVSLDAIEEKINEAVANVQNDSDLQSLYDTFKNHMDDFEFEEDDIDDLTKINRNKSNVDTHVINYSLKTVASLASEESDIDDIIPKFLHDLVYCTSFDAKDQTEQEAVSTVQSDILNTFYNVEYYMQADMNLDDDIRATLKNLEKLFECFEEEKRIDKFQSNPAYESFILGKITFMSRDIRNRYDNQLFELTKWMNDHQMFDTRTYKYACKMLVESRFRRENPGQPVKIVDFDDSEIEKD